MLNPFKYWVRCRVAKRSQGNVGPGVLWLVPVDTGMADLSIGEWADGRPRDAGALYAVWSYGVSISSCINFEQRTFIHHM